jgi:DNA-binding XRE family transcriptional regulator
VKTVRHLRDAQSHLQKQREMADLARHAAAMAAHRAGADPGLTDAEMDAFLAAPSPLGFWRKKRGLTQAALAEQVGISRPFMAQLESGRRGGDVETCCALGAALGVAVEDLLSDL